MEYKQQNVICQNCKTQFTIEPEDFKFYEKMETPPPTWCPECRLIRRLTHIGDRFLFKDKCDKCEKEIVSLYRPDTSYIVFCNNCWWGDSWNQLDYGRDYDFSKPFFEQFLSLQNEVPYQATDNRNCTNCDFCDTTIRSKNCRLTFGSFQSINCYYCGNPIFSRDLLDSDVVVNADHTYATIYSNSVYNTKFVYFSNECMDSAFLFNCIGCSNCFGCVNLRNQKYCIFNKQYTKEEYEKEIKKWNLSSYQTLKKAEKIFTDLYYKIPRRFAMVMNSTNVTGDNIKNTKNCKNCFITIHGVENCKNIFTCGLLLKDSQDTTTGGDTSELFYENASGLRSQRIKFSHSCNDSTDIEYSNKLFNCSNCFGCIMLRNKKYCILNKQYTKKEYENMVSKIKKHMNEMPYIDSKGRIYKYGEFLPSGISLWAYNETWANQFFPKTKTEAIKEGFSWREPLERDYKITLLPEKLPDSIEDVSDSILNEIIACEHSGLDCNHQCVTAFRILPYELNFYRSMKIPLPRKCFNCRFYERLEKVNPPKLWHRRCMCNGVESSNGEYKNTIKHSHGDSPCQNEFETAISDERKEIVYCEKCYQNEFI